MFKKLVGLLTVTVAGLFLSGVASAQITGTAHDLQTELGNSDICVVCHAPHNNQNADGELLWNHDPSANVGLFTTYSSVTLDPGASPGQPGPVSLLCLSCHDGSVAVDSFGGTTGTLNIDNIAFTTGQTPFGISLGNDHPIGLTYIEGAANEMNTIATTAVTFGDASAGFVSDLLFGADVVECASCHDVHATESGGSGGNPSLLRVSNTGSQLCLSCHTK